MQLKQFTSHARKLDYDNKRQKKFNIIIIIIIIIIMNEKISVAFSPK